MTELFLIAHKVRGEPAFDVATQLQIGEELGWVIPTSGHRAYPYWWYSLNRVINTITWVDQPPTSMPEGLRDHYAAHAAPAPAGGKITSLSLADLGL
jgi:hypothetical protein